MEDRTRAVLTAAINVRIRESPIPNADGHLLRAHRFSHATCLFSVHSWSESIGTAIGYQPVNGRVPLIAE
jgi:hypothetical protein